MLKIFISTEEGKKDSERLKHTDSSEFHALHIRNPNWGIKHVRVYRANPLSLEITFCTFRRTFQPSQGLQ